MAGYKEDIILFGGLNEDDAPLVLPEGDYLNLTNAHNGTSMDGKKGFVESYDGTLELDIDLPTGINKVIGVCPDPENSHLYYAIYNSLGNHSIARIHTITNTVEYILRAEILIGFVPDKLITTMILINGYLVWCQREEAPKKINVDKALLFTQDLPGGYNTLNSQIFDFINWAPLECPTCLYQSDVTIYSNYLRGKLFKFAYRWVYSDGSKSTFSPWSKVPLPQNDEVNYSLVSEDITSNNVIQVTVKTGIEDVIRIEVAFSFDDGLNWYLGKVIEKFDSNGSVIVPSGSTKLYYFFNNEAVPALDLNDFLRPYDYVPLKSEAITVLKDSRVAIGGCVEGFDNVPIDISLSVVAEEVDVIPNEVFVPVTESGYNNAAVFKVDLAGTLPQIQQLNIFEIRLKHVLSQASYFFRVQTGNVVYSIAQLIDAICDRINDGAFGVITTKVPGAEYFYIRRYVTWGQGTTLINIAEGKFLGVMGAEKTWKRGSTVNIGIQYYDRAGRFGAVNISDDSKLYIHQLSEQNSIYPVQPGESFTELFKVKIQYAIKHLPPDWAVKYQIVAAHQPIIYKQFLCDVAQDGRHTRVKLNECVANSGIYYPGINITDWAFEKGDHIRIIANANHSTSVWIPSAYVIDREVISQDESTGDLLVNYIDPDIYGMSERPLIEIYRNIDMDAKSQYYYELGEIFDINTSGGMKYHAGQLTNQDPNDPDTIPATGILSGGNAYLRLRRFRLNNADWSFPVEDASYSDFFDSIVYDYGRVNVVNADAKQQRLEIVRHGGRFIETTRINNLYSFSYSDYAQLSTKYGKICMMVEVGNMLKVIQAKKISRIGIGVREINSADGTAAITTIDSVFGSVVPYDDNYGCIHPESIRFHNRYIYFWDQINGMVVRDSHNGMFPISSYKMNSRFKQIQSRVYAGSAMVYGGIDNRYDYYIIHVVTSPIDYSECLVFDEAANRWKHRLSMYGGSESSKEYVEFIGDVNTETISFINGVPFMHHKGSDALNFFDLQHKFEVKFVSNVNPKDPKTVDAIHIYTNNTAPYDILNPENSWDVSDIRIPASLTTHSEKVSRLKAPKFKRYEEHLEAEVLRDMNTPMAGNAQEKLLNGDVMKGDHCIFTMSHRNRSKVWLKFVSVFLSPSDVKK